MKTTHSREHWTYNRTGIKKKSHIKLDRYGSTLWIHINGDNTVFNLVSIMEEHFPEEAPDMLKRVIAFLETLERVRFIYLL